VLLNCSRPVLVLPLSGGATDIGKRITVAWNGSDGATRAITSALPLLKHADKVDLVVFDAAGGAYQHGAEPGADMALYLARHGIDVEVAAIGGEAAREDGGGLLSFAAERRADLIVMGAYGHSRFREFVLGGVSRTLLAAAPIALWMAH
jgi:nucleotide-binding universal stress UspA family protein